MTTGHWTDGVPAAPIETTWANKGTAWPPAQLPDPVVETNRDLLLKRSRAGFEKYKTTLANAGLSREQLLQHLLEELLDAANYTQAELQRPRRVVAWRYVIGGAPGTAGTGYGPWVDGDRDKDCPMPVGANRVQFAYSE